MPDFNGIDFNGLEIPKPASGFYLETFDGETVLYHVAQTQAVYLNETAGLIFRLCDGKRCAEEICSLLREAYRESPDQVKADVFSTLKRLADSGAILF
jgi:hypothetical protein